MDEPGLPAPFDYSTLDEQSREIVLRKTDETHGLMKRTAEGIIAIGQNLLTVQQHLPEMKFSEWLRAEFDLSHQSAYNFMHVASRFAGSCKAVLQLPARVLYELASSSDAIVEQVKAGQLPATVAAIKAAREAERIARAETQARQAMIERLTRDLEGMRQRLANLSIPEIQVREVEKVLAPSEVTAQLETLQEKVVALTQQRDSLSQQVAELQEQARSGASERFEGNTSGAFASTGTGSPVSFSAACALSCPSGHHPSMS